MSLSYTTPPARGSSAAAVGDDVRVGHRTGSISAAAPAPGEGLPPCIRRLTIIDDRQACWHDMAVCPRPVPDKYRCVITAGHRGPVKAEDDCTNGAVRMLWPPCGLLEATDDPAEAEAAWERAERWVRTGVLDD